MGGRSKPEVSKEQKELERLQANQLKREQEKTKRLEQEAQQLAAARRQGGAVGAGRTPSSGVNQSVFSNILGG